eukprot:TRINITY_DN6048_c0_g2_i1.p1 TRINITY_DN6048_c0_g2~~TRINITY_DN6048_c0_g2_i1.p1  ORF type:complete len:145 (+),score=13.88 TRINITY_DN6048_c0_g2_i1:105-539(+)
MKVKSSISILLTITLVLTGSSMTGVNASQTVDCFGLNMKTILNEVTSLQNMIGGAGSRMLRSRERDGIQARIDTIGKKCLGPLTSEVQKLLASKDLSPVCRKYAEKVIIFKAGILGKVWSSDGGYNAYYQAMYDLYHHCGRQRN